MLQIPSVTGRVLILRKTMTLPSYTCYISAFLVEKCHICMYALSGCFLCLWFCTVSRWYTCQHSEVSRGVAAQGLID